MGVMNVLAGVGMPIYSQLHSISLNWIGKIILWLTTVCGSVGVGIILFSLLLKLITMPFDVFQRINMRKQNLKMKENQARMEKLQKQYANDKEKYNQKVMEMYRESGISMMSSCLPMILSLVIFIVAINAFNVFSSYSNVENYNTMVRAYNENMLENCAEFDEKNLTWTVQENTTTDTDTGVSTVTGMTVTYTVAENDKYIYYTVTQEVAPTVDGQTGEQSYVFDETVFEENKADILKYVENSNKKNYFLNWDKYSAENGDIVAAVEKSVQDEATAANQTLTADELKLKTQQTVIKQEFVSPAQDKVVEVYHSTVKKNTQFLWIKNVWAVDATYKHPVLSYGNFSQEIIERKSCSCKEGDKSILMITAYSDEGYHNVTGKLGAQKSEANGYYIMVLLSIGTILLQQLVSMRSQKEQNKYSSVDGQSGSQQKMMMIIMTGMFAVFSFMYSSAFSIYMVVSNLFSLLSMIVINKLVDVAANRKAAGATAKGEKVLSGRAAAVNRNKDKTHSDKKNNKKK